ncbi:MAG: hypothetical protein NTX82_05670 [Candidatus Parcubacteria bacterium]|nr:hypothetical protein [Candidatus Parcubacteria bacterium]
MAEEKQNSGNEKKRWGNWCKKCGKEHENMGVEQCDCGGKTDIFPGPPDIKGSTPQNGRIIPL